MRLRGDSRHLRRTLSRRAARVARSAGRPQQYAGGWRARGCMRAAYQLGAGLGRTETAERPREPWLPSTRAMVCCHLDSRQKLQLDSRIYLLMRKTS